MKSSDSLGGKYHYKNHRLLLNEDSDAEFEAQMQSGLDGIVSAEVQGGMFSRWATFFPYIEWNAWGSWVQRREGISI